MKQIINGKRYDTNTATMVADVSPEGFYHGDFRYEETQLYRTPRGNWFLAGWGEAMSRLGQADRPERIRWRKRYSGSRCGRGPRCSNSTVRLRRLNNTLAP